MKKELFTRMQYEPSILMFGKKYRMLVSTVLSYNWNTIITTNCELELSASIVNEKRYVREVMTIDDMKANLTDRKNLHIIRLFGEHYPNDDIDGLEAEDIIDSAVAKLSRITEVIKHHGIILIENFEENCFSHKEFRKAFRSLSPNQKQVYIFNCKEKDSYLQYLEKQGIAVFFKESINDFFEEYFSGDEDDFELEKINESVKIYINAEKKAKPISLESRYLLDTENFATLLSINLLNEIKIPQSMYKDYFYTFLKNSVREPQWYGYNYEFNLHREYEKDLYRKVKNGLENVGKTDNKPLLIVGQTGTGKSIALAAIAYKIFNEKKYPVIYINNPEVNFYSNIKYKHKGITKKESEAFNALDALIKHLEEMGSKAILVVWDTSSYSANRNKCHRLYQSLLARGRQVYLLGTAYEMNKQNKNIDNQEENVEDSVLNTKFVECNASVEISDEVEQLKELLLKKCNMNNQDVENIMSNYVCNSTNFLSMLYQAFEMLREDLSKGVSKEAAVNLQELNYLLEGSVDKNGLNNIFVLGLKKIENELIASGIVDRIESIEEIEKDKINIAKDEFIKCIAVCSQFKLKVPFDFALRILGSYNEKIIRTLTKSTFFIVGEDYYGNYEISLRTPLESAMYISAKNMNSMDEVECIIKMLNLMKVSGEYGQQSEVRLCERLIRVIGPNNQNVKTQKSYKQGYSDIIETLKNLRLKYNIWEPILITQEITYIREYYGRDETLEKSERIASLEEAIRIANDALSKIENTGIPMGTRNAIIVESANSKILLFQLNESKDPLLFKELKRDLRNVIRYDNSNYHAYVTLMKGSIIEYQNEPDGVKKIELLESMCSVIDEIMLENSDVADSEYFRQKVTQIYLFLKDSDIAQAYIDELVENGSAAGLYVKAKKILTENNVDFRKNITKRSQELACKKVYDLFRDNRYKTILEESEPCQYMLINIIWLMNNKEPIYLDGECWITKIHEKVWQELLNICSNFILKFSNDAAGVYQSAKNIRYLKALCLAQLGQYVESISVLKSIEEDLSLGRRRVFTKHMICEADGKPRKFTGRLGKYNEISRSGSVYIDEFGKHPIYYHGPHLKTSKLTEGIVFKDIEIGYSNIAPKAFRGIGVNE